MTQKLSLSGDYEEKSLNELPVVVVDTETTGLMPEMGHRVVEVAALRLENMQEVGHFSRLVNPGRAMDPGATRVNGITDQDLANAPTFGEIWPELHHFLKGALLVGHNAAFDAAFLGMEYHLASLNDFSQTSYSPQLNNPWLCTMLLARRFFYFERNSLGNIARELGVRSSRAHRALNDVYTTVAIFRRMTVDLARMGFHTAGELLHAQGGPIFAPTHSPRKVPNSLREAMKEKAYLRVRYRGQSGETERVIRPLYIKELNGREYLVAHCMLRQAQRTFRLDRIRIIVNEE